MARSRFSWISSAESCRIWDENHSVTYQFSGIQNHVSDVAWSPDNKNIVLVQKDCADVVTAKITANLCPAQNVTTINEAQPSAIGFSNDNLIVGTKTGVVLLWDHNKHKLIRKHIGTDKSSVRKIQSNSSIIAAGHAGGGVFVYGVKTGQLTGHYTILNSMALRDLKISTVKPSLLAATFDSGTVAVWNTVSKTSNSPIAEFTNIHLSPATCLALSPITDMLMVSGGLDKNIILYDCPKKKILKKIEADAPVTSIDFVPDGTALMVGTNKGKVLIYDLRSVSIPVHTLTAHTSAVTKLICRPISVTQNQGTVEAVACKVPPKSTLHVAPEDVLPSKTASPNKLIENATPIVPSVPSRVPISLMTCLSDRRRSSSHGSVDSLIGEPHRIPKFPSLDSVNASRDLEPHKNSSLFSPLKGEASETFSSPSIVNSPILTYRPPQFSETVQPTPKPIDDVVSSPQSDNQTAATSPIASVITSPATRESPVNPEFQAKTSQAAEMPDSAAPSGDFQAEFIRRLVRDVEENLREVLRCRFGDLIVQSAQQFLTIQTELEQLKQQVQDKAYLEEEVRRLRAEVNHLRNLY